MRIASAFIFGFVTSIFLTLVKFYHIFSICSLQITHFPSSDFMALSNYNYTLQALYQSSVLYLFAKIRVFKNAEKLLEVLVVIDELYLIFMTVIFIAILKDLIKSGR